MSRWRHAVAIVLLPGTVTILLPALILRGDAIEWGWDVGGAAEVALVFLGVVVGGAGFGLWAWTVRLFATVGEGTLAPWDPTGRLVAVGPYGHVRNPMISGVVAILTGEALAFGSPGIAIWAVAVLVINHVYFIAIEEPGLVGRFGEPYEEYRRRVPRWIPRRAP